MLEFADLLVWFAYVGTAVFAISGALLGLRKEMDIIGVSFVATLTGIGGGTIRDLLLGDTPVAWVRDPTELIICVVFAVGVSLFNTALVGRRMTWLLYADAIGMALFAVLGAAKAETLGAHPFVAVLFGAMSATFGGIIRDIICDETPVIFQKEIYVSAALLGAFVFIATPQTLGFEVRALLGLGAGLMLRLCAIWFDWRMPFPRYSKPDE